MFEQAVASFRAGRLADAERALERLLQQSPNHFDALHLLGVIARQTRRSELAVQLIRRAIRENASVPAAHRHLANALIDLRRPQEAVASFGAAIRLKRDFVEAYIGRGFAWLEVQQPAPAFQDFDQAVALQPNNVAALHGRAAALSALRRSQEALACCDQALRVQPDCVEVLIIRAMALRDLKRPAEALVSCERAALLRPGAAQPLIVQGAAFADLERAEDALRCFERALALSEEAAAYNGRGSVLLDLQRPHEALACFERALELKPDFANAHNNRGIALSQTMQFEPGLACLERACALEPDSRDYQLNAAHAYLQLGRFEQGWQRYECRPKQGCVADADAWPQPRWLGQQDIAGKTLLLQAEQGLGDSIQFSRYARCLQARGADVVLSVPARLLRLLRRVDPAVRCVAETEPPPAFDFHCRLLSLPLALQTTLQTIPAAVPYLSAEPQRVALWQQRLGGEGLRIGVNWQGRPSRMDLGRSFPPGCLEPIASIAGVRLISLQKHDGTEQMHALPGDMRIEVLEQPFDEGPDAFVDTAAIMRCLDLVITSDTSVAHLAGALGVPTWVALQQVPDWRWLLHRADSPWYPQMRLFRQSQRGDWSGVFAAMRAALLAHELHRIAVP
jgi:tetratricopeptide (TPR) repeat protein